jgi:hypothetical protein
MTRKPKKTKAKSEAQRFEDVARKLFKVPKTEIDPTAKKD